MKKRHTPGANYEVGYCKPPKETRFKKGTSGNPSGRPRKPVTMAEALHRELNKTTFAEVDGQKQKITKMEAAVKRLIDKSIGGDMSAFRVLSVLSSVLNNQESAVPSSAELEAADQEIIDRLVRQLAGAAREERS